MHHHSSTFYTKLHNAVELFIVIIDFYILSN